MCASGGRNLARGSYLIEFSVMQLCGAAEPNAPYAGNLGGFGLVEGSGAAELPPNCYNYQQLARFDPLAKNNN
jgi:hypothetical protein